MPEIYPTSTELSELESQFRLEVKSLLAHLNQDTRIADAYFAQLSKLPPSARLVAMNETPMRVVSSLIKYEPGRQVRLSPRQRMLMWRISAGLLFFWARFFLGPLLPRRFRLELRGCFPAHALISTPDGPRRIADVQTGDPILSWNGSRRVVEQVTAVMRHRACRLVNISLEHGRSMQATPNHIVLTTRGWRRIDRLAIDEQLVGGDGNANRLTRVEFLAAEPVFNLHTTGEHNFIVDGIVMHNFVILRRTRTWLHQVFVDRRHRLHVTPQTASVRQYAENDPENSTDRALRLAK